MIQYLASFVLLFFLASCGGSNSSALDATGQSVEGKPLGTWILTTSSFDDPDNVTSEYILGNLASRGIKYIDQLVTFELLSDNSYQIANEDYLIDFIEKANAEGIHVNLLINDQELFNISNYEDTMKKVETILDLNSNLYSIYSINLLGIKFRVDLERSQSWIAGHHDATYNYLYFLYQINLLLEREGSSLLISADVDHAWDSGEYAISFNNKDKNLVYHIIDIVDYVTVLSFSRSAGGVMEKIEDELQYLKDEQLANRVVPVLAVSPIDNLYESFYGIEDSTYFWDTLDELQYLVADEIGVPIIMIEHFEYFDQIPPVPAN